MIYLIKGDLTGTLNAFRCKIRQDFGNNIEVDPILDEMRTLHGSLSEVTMKAKKDQVAGKSLKNKRDPFYRIRLRQTESFCEKIPAL